MVINLLSRYEHAVATTVRICSQLICVFNYTVSGIDTRMTGALEQTTTSGYFENRVDLHFHEN